MKCLFAFCFLLLTVHSQAQHGSIKGKIIDPDHRPLTSITIQIQNTSLITVTDEEGNFFLGKIPAGNHTLLSSGIGYLARKENVTVEPGKTTTLSLELDRSRHTLKEVVIRQQRRPENATGITRSRTPLRDLPQSVQLVGRGTINDQQLFTVDEALKNVAGVNYASPMGSFYFRGYQTNARDFLTNGMKGSPYPEGVIPLLGNIEQVEVIHGPAAILYGSGTVGGNINLVSKQPKRFTTVNASVGAGSFSLYRAQADVTGAINKKKNLYFLAGADYQHGGRFTKGFDNENAQVFGSLKWDLSPRSFVQLHANYLRDRGTSNFQPEVPIYKDSLFALPRTLNVTGSDASYKGDSYQLQLIAQHGLGQRWKLHLLGGFNEARAERVNYSSLGYVNPATHQLQRAFTRQTIHSPAITANVYVSGEFTALRIKHHLTAGGDLSLLRNNYPEGIRQFAATPVNVKDPQRTPFNETNAMVYYYSRRELFRHNTTGLYVQDQLEITPQLKALAGLRFNHYYMRYHVDSLSYDMATFNPYDEKPLETTSLIPRLGVVYQPFTSTSFYIDYNQGFIPQYGNTREAGGPFKPETAHQLELGFKGNFFNGKLQPTLAVYRNTKQNVLTPDLDDPNRQKRRAVGEVRSDGIEIGVTGNIAERWQYIANYSYNHTKITKSNRPAEIGQQFSNSPHHMANGWVTWQVLRKKEQGLKVAVGGHYTGDRFIGSKQVDKQVLVLPEYFVADAMVSYQYTAFTLQLNVNNLFDKKYAQGSAGTMAYFPGTPRQVMVSLLYHFEQR